MTKELFGAIVLLVALLVIAAVSVRARSKRVAQQGVYQPPTPLRDLLRPEADSPQVFSALYLATTPSTEPLVRINAYGLGARGNCQVLISSTALGFDRRGEASFELERTQIVVIDEQQAAHPGLRHDQGLQAAIQQLCVMVLDLLRQQPGQFVANRIQHIAGGLQAPAQVACRLQRRLGGHVVDLGVEDFLEVVGGLEVFGHGVQLAAWGCRIQCGLTLMITGQKKCPEPCGSGQIHLFGGWRRQTVHAKKHACAKL